MLPFYLILLLYFYFFILVHMCIVLGFLSHMPHILSLFTIYVCYTHLFTHYMFVILMFLITSLLYACNCSLYTNITSSTPLCCFLATTSSPTCLIYAHSSAYYILVILIHLCSSVCMRKSLYPPLFHQAHQQVANGTQV